MSEYRGFVFDIDGTAVPNGAASVESVALKESFRKLPAAVIAIAATGRSPEFALPITKELSLKHESIVANGALIVDSGNGEIRWHRLLSEKQLAQIIEVCSEYDYRFWVTGDDIDDDRPASYKQPKIAAAAFLTNVPVEDAHDVRERLLQIIGVNAYLAPAWSGEENHFDVSIGHIEASKSRALAELYERYSLKPEEMMGIGDGINDIELFEAVGHKIAVANANPRLIELADEVVPSQEEDGMIEIVRRFRRV